MLGVFVRLGDLFDDLAHFKGLDIYDSDKQYTRIFKLWCAKLDELTIEQVSKGIATLELRVSEAARDNVKYYPPNYAQFKGMCLSEEKKANVRSTFEKLPPSVLTGEDRKERMKKLRGDLRI